MAFLGSKRAKQNFRLFEGFAYYTPGVRGMFALLFLLLAGTLVGQLCTLLIARAYTPRIAATYGLLVTYPLMFVPPMIYASYKSRRNALFETGYSLNSRHFGTMSGAAAGGIAVVAMLLATYLTDIFNYWNYCLTMKVPALASLYEIYEKTVEGLIGGPLWVSVLSAAIMAPLFEEWLCRGEILRGLLQKMRPAGAIVLSAAFFALIHGNPWQALFAFLIGCLLGYVYYRTGSLYLTMLMHCANNTAAILTAQFSGEEDPDYFIEILGPGMHWAIFAVCALALFCILRLFRRIPVEGRSNCDAVREEEEPAR